MIAQQSELDADILAYLANDLDPARQKQLDRRLCAEPAVAVRFAQLCRHEVALAAALTGAQVVSRPRLLPRRPLPRRASPWWWVAAAVLLATIGSGTMVYAGQHKPSPLAIIVESTAADLAIGRSLYADTPLMVGARLAFAYPDGSRIDLEPGSRATLLADPGKRIAIERGTLQASVMPQPAGRPLRVTTPQGEALVVGTHFTLLVDASATRLTVTEGKVQLSRLSDGASCLVKAGFSCTASESTQPLALHWATRLAEHLPRAAQIVWQAELSTWEGESGSPSGFAGLHALGSHAPQPGTRFMGEIRSPTLLSGPTAGHERYLALRYLAAGFRPGDQLKFMLKNAQGAIYHGIITPQIDVWTDAVVRLDGSFVNLDHAATGMPEGMPITQIVLLPVAPDGKDGVSGPRVWLGEVLTFTTAEAVAVEQVNRP